MGGYFRIVYLSHILQIVPLDGFQIRLISMAARCAAPEDKG